ncbi:MAG: hypothetical protein K2J76_06250, partial [Oscillospiraceae bacterium]|nr:hypothetical protein [Oscillospiraceae bacterium]
MFSKKITLIFTAVIMLLTLAACAKVQHVIPLSKLEFGMTREQTNSLIEAEPDITGDDHDIYLDIPSDLDARLNSCIFNYNGAERLFGVYIESDYMKESEAEALLTDIIIEKLYSLYGFSDSSWVYEFDEEENSFTFVNIDGKIVIKTQINSYDEGFNVSVTVMSDEHNEDENADNIPV